MTGWRIRISMAHGREDAYTTTTKAWGRLFEWAEELRKSYPNNLLVIQHNTDSGWIDWKLAD